MMKIKIKLLILIIPIFCFGACRNDEEKGQILFIQNHSNYRIVPIFAFYKSMDNRDICIKPTNKFEMADLEDVTIPPISSKTQTGIANFLIDHPSDTLYVYIYNRIDIDNMSCEEFNRERPIQKSWAITKADAEAMNWTLVYELEE